MRFQDIPQFPHCGYRIDVAWTMLERHIEEEEENGLDLNPDFQRAHVWTADQQSKYVEYILRGGTSGKELYFNCKDWHRAGRELYVIVDGKQRLQAVREFMRGNVTAFGHRRHAFTDNPDSLTARFSWNIAALNTRAEVLEWYVSFNEGGTVHTKEELDRVRELLAAESMLEAHR
jgi:hypothetical protein